MNAAGKVVALDAIYWLLGAAAAKVTTLTVACTAFASVFV